MADEGSGKMGLKDWCNWATSESCNFALLTTNLSLILVLIQVQHMTTDDDK